METEPKRKSGRIYSIVALDPEFKPEDTYYGSTFQSLSKRFFDHRHNYQRWKDGKYGYTSSFSLFEKYGVDLCKIVLVEELQGVSKDERERHEYQYVSTFPCCNLIGKSGLAGLGLTHSEYNRQDYELNKDRYNQASKLYRELNKETISEKQKQYRRANKEKISQRDALYRSANKEKIAEIQAQYRNANKEKIAQKNALYRRANQQKIAEMKVLYRIANKEDIAEKQALYRSANKEKIALTKSRSYLCDCGSTCQFGSKSNHLKSMRHLEWEKSQNE